MLTSCRSAGKSSTTEREGMLGKMALNNFCLMLLSGKILQSFSVVYVHSVGGEHLGSG